MLLPAVSPDQIRRIIARFNGAHVLVVGDVMLDRFVVGRVTRISPEAPVPVVRFHGEQCRLGGAANVAHNVAALGGRPSLIGVVGADQAGDRFIDQLRTSGIAPDGLVRDPDRPTTEKVRVVTERNQQVVRIDYERDADVADAIEREIVECVARLAPGAKTLLVSDYLKGTVTRPVVEALLKVKRTAASVVPLVVDPKIPHLACYAGATLITPNHHEAETATHRRIQSDDDARGVARDFRERAKCEGVLI